MKLLILNLSNENYDYRLLFSLALSLITTILISSCNTSFDVPWKNTPTEGKRMVSVGNYNEDSTNSTYSETFQTTNSTSTTKELGQTTNDYEKNTNNNSATTTELPSGFLHCKLNSTKFNFEDTTIGDFNICVNSVINTDAIIFQSKNAINEYKLCFYPVFIKSNLESTMIGKGECISSIEGNKIIQINFLLDTNVNLKGKLFNGIMIIKDLPYNESTPYHFNVDDVGPSYPTAYEDCMRYLQETGDDVACERFSNKKGYVLLPFNLIQQISNLN
ncbi:MAG: hypothetical protein HQK49_08970 [Oligoflexia bacterium]|nr:hypothetical protein [Oligoflexia bacterium]